tara:strand:- start:9889 stop:10932 length:1044 start_codon:yes stop_codon:yes gene_type:complete
VRVSDALTEVATGPINRYVAVDRKGRGWVDRDQVDYWRTIKGTRVGFTGDPGSGNAFAGPRRLTGGSSPLHREAAKEFAGTWIGRALRKKNFPRSTARFLDEVVGRDESIEEASDKVYDELNEFVSGSAIYKYQQPHDGGKGNLIGARGFLQARHGASFSHFEQWWGSSSGDGAKQVSGLLSSFGIVENKNPAESYDPSGPTGYYQRPENAQRRGSAIAMLRDMYLLSQAIERRQNKRGYTKVYRGIALSKARQDPAANKIVNDLIGSGIETRVIGRPIASYSRRKAKAKDFAPSGAYGAPGFVFEADVPREAILFSAGLGFGHMGGGERETIPMGCAEIRGKMNPI